MSEPRGVSLCNPCNLKWSPDFVWQGEMRPTSDPEGVLCEFDDMVDGVRAAAKLLLNYQKIDGLTTLTQIIARFAPPDPNGDKNPTAAYTANVAEWMGVGSLDPIDITDGQILQSLVASISRQEQGYGCICDTDLAQGVAEALA